MPGEFIPVAQETSLIKELTLHVINDAGLQWRAGRTRDAACRSRSTSPGGSGRSCLSGEVATLLGKWRIACHNAQVRGHEGSVADDPRRTEDVLERLGAMGLRLSSTTSAPATSPSRT